MSIAGELILIHIVTGITIWYCLASLFGRMADRAYDQRMSSSFRFFLMPGRLAERAVYTKVHRVWAGFCLAFITVVYIAAMLETLR